MSTEIPNFYQTGGNLPPDAPSYVERQADRDLYDALTRGEFCYVLTSRQMGKSSLMVHTAARLRAAGAAVAVLDLTAIGQNLTVEQWYDGLLVHLGRQLRLEEELEDHWLEYERQSPLQRWLGALHEVVLARVPGRIVIFIDEIDAVRSLPFSTDEFFAAIRQCYNRRTQDPEYSRLTFSLLGVATPSDLIQDTRTTPFNMGRRIELRDFTEAEAAPLANGLGRDQQTNDTLLQRLLYWTGGQPYLTQRLCQSVATDPTADPHPESIDRLCAELFFTSRAQERDDNLLFVRERLLNSEVDAASLLDLYGRVRRGQRVRDDDTNRWVSLLRLSGIVRSVGTQAVGGSYLQVRNRIYGRVFDREWITTHMPDAELRRQRAAFKRGLLRASSMATVVVGVISGLALTAFHQARRAEDRERTGRRLLYVAQMNVAYQAWKTGNLKRAQELLDDQRPGPGEEDLRGFEWRYLWRFCQGDQLLTLSGHTEGVWAVAFSPDGKTLASASGSYPQPTTSGEVKLWDVDTNHEVATLPIHQNGTYSVAFSPDGEILACAGGDHTIRLWSVGLKRELAELTGHNGPVRALAFTPSGKTLASGSGDGTVRLWDITTRRQITALSGFKSVSCVAFSPDGRTLASGSDDEYTVRLWDVARARKIASLKNEAWSLSLAFSPDGRTLAAANLGRTIRLWDTAMKQHVGSLEVFEGAALGIAFSPDGRTLATAAIDGAVRLWDVATRRRRSRLLGHMGRVTSVAFSPDGKTLATGSLDRTVRLWGTRPRLEADTLRGASGWVWSVAFSPDGKTVAGTGDDAVNLWNVARGRRLASLPHRGWHAGVAFSPDGRFLASSASTDNGGTIPLWNLTSKQKVTVLPSERGGRAGVAFSPDGTLLAAEGQDHTIRLWQIPSKLAVGVFRGHKGPVNSLAFAPDGRMLASASSDLTVRLWDVAARRQRNFLKGHLDTVYRVAFSPDGRTLASASDDGKVKLWEVATGRELASLTGHPSVVIGVAFSPDGKTLASIGDGLRLWNVATRQEVATLAGGASLGVAFSPDGNTLAGSDHVGRVRLWRAPTFAETDARRRGTRAPNTTGEGRPR